MRYPKISLFASAVIFSLLAAPGCSTAPQSGDLRQLILGTWLPDPEYDQDPPSKSTYYADGTLKFVAYASENCEYVMSASGHWYIIGNMLHGVIDQSTNTDMLPIGLEMVDEIISMTATHKVLKAADDGELQYRLKGDICA